MVWTEFRTASDKRAEAAPDVGDIVTSGDDDQQQRHREERADGQAVVSPRSQALDRSSVIDIDDRVQVQVSDDLRIRVVTLTSDRHEPDLGFISIKHPSGAGLLGAEEDDEIDFDIEGKSHRWMVLKIEKASVSAS
jgi:transcription elongation GreA/GreB family factor